MKNKLLIFSVWFLGFSVLGLLGFHFYSVSELEKENKDLRQGIERIYKKIVEMETLKQDLEIENLSKTDTIVSKKIQSYEDKLDSIRLFFNYKP